MKKFILSFAVLLFLATQALAYQDFKPPWLLNPTDPQWAGGSATSQSWEFPQHHPADTVPTHVNNPFGSPVLAGPGGGAGFDPNGPGLTGIDVWSVSPGGGFDLTIPNDPLQRDTKIILIQFTTHNTADLGGDSLPPQTNPPAATNGVVSAGAPVVHPNNWNTYGWYITIHPNPEFENIMLRFPNQSNIEELNVDTICIPEPASLTLLVMGGLALVGFVWRRRSN